MKVIIILLFFTGLFANHNVHHVNKELTHLDLSEEQNLKIKKLLLKFRTELKNFREYKQDIEDKRKKLFTENVLNLKEFKKLNNDLHKKTNDIESKLFKSIHNLLDKKQRYEFMHYFDDWKVQ